MKLFKNIYTFLVGENKDISEICNYPLDNQGNTNISNNLFVYEEITFDKEFNFEEEKEEEKEEEEKEKEEEKEEKEEKEEEEYTKKYWLYSEEYKDEFVEDFVNEIKKINSL